MVGVGLGGRLYAVGRFGELDLWGNYTMRE